MRVFARTPVDEFGNRTWIVVETDAQGYDDYVYFTAMAQTLQLNLGESPFYGRFGIPAKQSIQSQIQPDYAVAYTQQYYAPHFASLVISKQPLEYVKGQPPTPTYNVFALRNNGSVFQSEIGK